MNESKETNSNNSLIITITGYYKLKDGMIGIRCESHEKNIKCDSIIHYIMNYYPAYKFLEKG